MEEETIRTPAQFPFKSTLSLSNIISYWEEKATQGSTPVGEVGRIIIEKLKAAPELYAPVEDLMIIQKHSALIELIMSAVFPSALHEDELAVAMPPFSLEPIYSTNKFATLFSEDAGTPQYCFAEKVDEAEMTLKKTLKAYSTILQQLYGIQIPFDQPLVIRRPDIKTGLDRYYKTSLNQKFCEIKVHGDLPVLTDAMIQEIKSNIYDVEVWKKYLPPQNFEFIGIAIVHLVDVTDQEILSSLKFELLEKDSLRDIARFDSIQQKVRILLGIPDLRLGLAAFQKNRKHFINFGKNICNSILLRNTDGLDCSCSADAVFEQFKKSKSPVVVNDLAKDETFGEFSKIICKETGLRNLVVAPLYNDGDFIGIVELGSPHPGDLNVLTLFKINQILSLFSIAIKRNSEELENQIRSIIRKNYTTIHPAVEWKFVNSAVNQINTEMKGLPINEVEPIVFEDVYALYGASDIRSSSQERNKAIKADLTEQLALLEETLTKIYKTKNIPLIEQMLYRIGRKKENLSREFISGDEASIVDFIKLEVEPLLDQLAKDNEKLTEIYESYKKQLDPQLRIIYHKRKEFEESLNHINELITTYLEQEEKKLQAVFPHYFEKYKTDGVEYNMYIGDAITEDQPFSPIYIHNLRLWQILSMAEIAVKTAALSPQLKVNLETTQLILVQSTPLSIRFRMDEKRFDVDGTYNVRYEIIKKRIDKALIKGTQERLTKPGSIAIVYTQEKEALEYKGYIEFLQHKNLLMPTIEELELEELQDIQGLKALRVNVNLESPEDILIQNLLSETLTYKN